MEYGFHVELAKGTLDRTAGYDVATLFVRGPWGKVERGSRVNVEDAFKASAVALMADLDGTWDGNIPAVTGDNSAYLGSNMAGNTRASN